MKTKQFLLASAFVAMMMIFLGGCEQLTDSGGGSSNDGGASGLPVGIYTATVTFGSTQKVVEVEIVSDNAII